MVHTAVSTVSSPTSGAAFNLPVGGTISTSKMMSDPAPGYVAWFKADSIIGLSDGDQIGTWEDSSLNNKDATQSTASFRPVYKTNVVAGKPAVRFDGVDDRLVSPGQFGIWGLGNDFTVFAVVWLDPSQGSGSHDVVGSSAISNTLDLIVRRNDGNGNWFAYGSSPDGTRNSDLILTTGEWYVLTWRLKAASPKHLQIRADKAYRLNDTGYSGIGTSPSQAAIGARQNGVNPFKGDIAEVIFYTGSLSDASMVATEDYLREKYGLVEPPPAPPNAPTLLTATAMDHQRIDLSWSDNATNEDGYRIERREGQTGTFNAAGTVGANSTTFSNQPLAGETEYCYRVFAYNAGGDSNASNVVCATTSPPPPPPPYGDPASGYSAWLKADGIVGLNDGDQIATWDDSSPNNKDATQSTASFRPVYKTNIVAGKPVVRFDGADDRLVSSSGSGIWGLTNDFTAFAAVWLDPSQGTGDHDVVGSSSISNNLDLIIRRNDANGNWLAYSSSPDGVRNSDLVLSTGRWYVLTWRLKATSPKHLQIRADTAYRLNDSGYTGIGTAPIQAAIGARQNGANPFKGDIAEVILYSGSLSDAEMTATENYLRLKYELTELGQISPEPPTGLAATAIDHQAIGLSWTDNATNELGFRIERRDGQAGSWVEIDSVGPNVTTYTNSSPALTPDTEYCYRVTAFNAGGDSASSNESCATTDTFYQVECTSDVLDARTHVIELLTSSDPTEVNWRTKAGLSNVDPSGLVLVEDDTICTALWNVVRVRPPYSGYFVAFFQLEDLYIVTEYPNANPSLGPVSLGRALTSVVSAEFEVQGSHLAE